MTAKGPETLHFLNDGVGAKQLIIPLPYYKCLFCFACQAEGATTMCIGLAP